MRDAFKGLNQWRTPSERHAAIIGAGRLSLAVAANGKPLGPHS